MSTQRPPVLSVCIPTHHGRCALLEQTLQSIAAQVTPELSPAIEIVVSDNASHDGTDAMVQRFRARHPDLAVVYGRNERDVRLANIMRVVERASGDWCWLFGSDDVMAEDGLRLVTRTIARHPQASGIGVGKLHFSHDLAAPLGQDPPAMFPQARRTTLYSGFEAVLSQLAFQHAYLGTNIVQRRRWLAAAEEVGDGALRRHPDWPHLVILAEMVRRDPSWVWLPAILVKSRAGRPYLVEQEQGEPNLARMHAVLVDSLREVWPEIAGRDTSLHRMLMRKTYAVGSAGVVHNIKLQHGQTLARDLLLLRSFTRAFWRLPEFRRRCLPLLLVPTSLGRRARAIRRRPMSPLGEQEMATQLEATVSAALRSREMADVHCVLTNRGSCELRSADPNPVALGFRWFDAATGALVLAGDRTPLPAPLRPGESVVLRSRINAPWEPGRYELRVAPVQEHVAWFDDRDPANGARFQVQLKPPPE